MKSFLKKSAVLLLIPIMMIRFSMTGHGISQYGNVYCRSTASGGKIALTFDDGPHPRYTKEILSILEEYGVVATFFVIGVNAVNYPTALAELVDSGCEIGNHTFSHKSLNKMNENEIKKEILDCEEILFELTGSRPKVFRPPQGIVPASLGGIVQEAHYNVVLWSIDTRDWAMNPSDQIVQTVLRDLKGGDIILMHDYVSGGNTTCDALRKLIPAILERGYEFVTVSEMIYGDHTTYDPHVCYSSILAVSFHSESVVVVSYGSIIYLLITGYAA